MWNTDHTQCRCGKSGEVCAQGEGCACGDFGSCHCTTRCGSTGRFCVPGYHCEGEYHSWSCVEGESESFVATIENYSKTSVADAIESSLPNLAASAPGGSTSTDSCMWNTDHTQCRCGKSGEVCAQGEGCACGDFGSCHCTTRCGNTGRFCVPGYHCEGEYHSWSC